MTTSTSIALEPLSADAFAPFGQVIEVSAASAADLAGDRFRAWGTDFSADGPVQVMLVHYDAQPLGIDQMERHVAVSQTFVALGGQASVMVVAAPTDGAARPSPADVRAFPRPRRQGRAHVARHLACLDPLSGRPRRRRLHHGD